MRKNLIHTEAEERVNVATATEPFLMTVEQYRELPQRDDVIQERHWGSDRLAVPDAMAIRKVRRVHPFAHARGSEGASRGTKTCPAQPVAP